MPPKKEIVIPPLYVSSSAQTGSRVNEPKYVAVDEVAKSMVRAVKAAEVALSLEREGSSGQRRKQANLGIVKSAARDSYEKNWEAYQQAAKEDAKSNGVFPVFRDLPRESYVRAIPSPKRRKGPRHW